VQLLGYYAVFVFLVTSLNVIEKHKQRVMGGFVFTNIARGDSASVKFIVMKMWH
jgi:hypothetical protein